MRPSMLIAAHAKVTKPGPKRDLLVLATAIEAAAESIEGMVARGQDTSPEAIAEHLREKSLKAIDAAVKVRS